MKYLSLGLLCLFAMAGSLHAQGPLITPETPVDYGTLHQWLHSGDPRLIAWAADFARRTHDAKIVAEMPELLDRWAMPQAMGDGESQAVQRRAVTAVLDTLIQENAQVPIPTIAAVAELFPAQAAILIGRLPLSQSRATLDGWTYYQETGTWSERTRARIASMMLAKDPGPSRAIWNGADVGFVASVVAASEEELQIRVVSAKTLNETPGSGCAGDSAGGELSPGWPQVYTYYLGENNPQAGATIIVNLDGDLIFSERAKENEGRGWPCGDDVEFLDPSTRHRLIAHWLGVPEKEMSWQPVEGFAFVWTDKAAYQRQLGKIVEAQREKLHATVECLRQRGFLTNDEAATVAPRLIVKVSCDIKPCPLI